MNDDLFMQAWMDYADMPANLTAALLCGVRDKNAIPQDVLYRTPDGAGMWASLTRDSTGSLGKVYRLFDAQQGPCASLVDELRGRLQKDRKPGDGRLGILALGSGDGVRERHLCQAILDAKLSRNLKTACVELSQELLRSAYREFRKLTPECECIAGCFSFENCEALRIFRLAHFGDRRCVVLLLGNTLGNVDERQMIGEIGAALLEDDILVVEGLTHERECASRLAATPISTREDRRIPFVMNPLRLLGVDPNIENVQIGTTSSCGGHRLTREYTYLFGEAKSRTVRHPYMPKQRIIQPSSSLTLLQIKSMTAEYLGDLIDGLFGDITVFSHSYDIGAPEKLKLAYAFGRRLGADATAVPVRIQPRGLELQRWRDLAIGISADACYAFAGPLSRGERVRLGRGVELDLKTEGQLYRLMVLLAQSRSGRKVPESEARHSLGRPESGQFTSNDKRFGRVDHGRVIQSPFSRTVADLTRKLKDKLRRHGVEVVAPAPGPIFRLNEGCVSSSPCFGIIFDDDKGNHTFGKKMVDHKGTIDEL